ncbi:hypothetical protein GWI33_013527 [Rhynchophorus ferrugineus]|uniref:Mitotic-spindle organizing protein 1 n=1 Tax=Rhynchophorus ferrugineus TaxID=354439 RepID=A0A834I6X5_RHYFE|nr:hypothetical protein GWI33_013527 [Rhynchophorus ferrugineus]
MDQLRPHQDELLYLAELAGIHMDKDLFRNLVQLLNMGVSPDAVFNVLKIIKKKKSEPHRVRRSHSSQKAVSRPK